MKNAKKYYIGIDMGTNSVGYAVTYDDYTLVKYKGEPMWGSTVFEEAMLCDKRRTFRSDRRRLNRRQQRVQLIRDIFAKEISKVDPDFYTRIQQSNLFREDKDNPERYNVFFNDKDYKDSDFYKKYPTIHHLIDELMHSEEPHDVRLVYIACAWLVAHRGHFLNEVSKENISDIIDFAPVYKRFTDYFIQNAIELPWECSAGEFAKILKKKLPITAKEKEFEEQLFGGKKPKDTADGEYPYNRSLIIKLLSGGEVKLSKLFLKNESGESSSLNLGMSDENIASVIAEFDTDADFILILKAMYDWAVLADILNGEECISRAKIKVYNRHDEDLKNLKDFVKEYIPEKYNEIFWEISPKLNNYVFYTDYIKKGEAYKGKREKSDGNDNEKTKKKKTKKEKFYEYLKKVLKTAETAKFTDEGVKLYNDIIEKITLGTFLPKQVDNDNRVIPYQLYWYELNEILKKAEKYLPFISEKDSDGISAKEKILSVFEFRIPYFIGPLSSKNSQFAWMERKADGMIYPWNIEDKVDFDKSEKEFISRMTNTCTYIPGENVLPKNSLLYVRYEILNTINNIKINGQPVSVEAKQKIFEELILKNPRISPKKLKNYLISEGLMTEDDVIGGIDTELTVIASAKTYFDFKNLINNGILTAEDAEKIIEHRTYSEDRLRFKRWVDKEFPDLPEKEKKYIYTMKYKGFGRLSEKLLRGIKGTYKKTEERGTIMDFLWNTNDNLMQILSDNYTFGEEIEKLKKEYYSLNNPSLNDILKNMYISNSVKRPIFRTLDIVKDIISVMGYEPEKIFIEAARGGSEEQKNKRTKSRKQQIKELYSKFNKKKDNPYAEEVRELSRQLEKLGDTADNKLQSDALFLYFMQLGRCMYSGEAIDFENSIYNIEHIYPQSRVKDDSILNNKVLTLSKYNGEKGDIYPINSEWQNKMKDFWSMLYENKFITAEKYKRLTRTTGFTDDEKHGFINRQLVETRQSTKAIKNLLGNKYGSEIVFIKAGLISDFRNEYKMLKSRGINDLHHAKDAYLNIVVGNVYSERFKKNLFNVSDKYSLKTDVIFENKLIRNNKAIWKGQESIDEVTKIMRKNCIRFTRYAFCRKGKLFDQQPLKAAPGLVPIKAGMDTEKYGGYNGTTASFFVLVLYTYGKNNKKELMIMPVELMHSDKFIEDEAFAEQYVRDTIKSIYKSRDVKELSFPLGKKRKLKINTIISLDGYKVALSRKTGQQIGLASLVHFVVPYETEKYIISLEKFVKKRKANSNIVVDTEYDEISAEKNAELYQIFTDKLSTKPFSIMPNCQYKVLSEGRHKFEKLPLDEQVLTLLNILLLFKTCRAGTTDLTGIDGSKNAGVMTLSSSLSIWKKSYSDVRIIDTSASGLHTKQSENLLDLL